MPRPRLLDLFCGAGGAAMGYHRAGFEVVGVDINDQPHYPFTFIRADALDLLESPWFDVQAFVVVHASPPCPRYSDATSVSGNRESHPDLIGPVRGLLNALGVNYVIENVEGSPLLSPITICGTAQGLGVDGYRIRRHREFESNLPLPRHACFCPGDPRPVIDVSGGGPTHAPRRDGKGGRTYKGTIAQKRAAMGIDWMTSSEITDAIPPAYTHSLGLEILELLEGATCVAA